MDKSLLIIFVTIMIVAGLLGYLGYTFYALDDAIDYNILHEQIMMNQTFVDSLDCEEIIPTMKALKMIISPNQQDEVEQLKEDFKRLSEEKRCN